MKENNEIVKKKIVIVGAGRRGSAIIETLRDDPEVEIVAVVDINEDAPGIKLAKRSNIPTAVDFVKLLQELKEVDVVFNATGETWVQEEIANIRKDVEIVGGISIKLVWGIIHEREKALALQRDLYRSTVGVITAAVESKSVYPLGHAEKVTAYATLLGQKMNLTSYQMEVLKAAALLHDIGKLSISQSILLKTGRLTPEEYEEIKKHPLNSESIVKSIEFLYNVLGAIRHHHERYNGKGYPDGLTKDRIPLAARILAVADSFAAMTSDRPYSKAKTYAEAAKEIERCSGTQFDPEIVKKFMEVLKEKFFKELIAEEKSEKPTEPTPTPA